MYRYRCIPFPHPVSNEPYFNSTRTRSMMHFFISAASLGFHVLIWCMPALFWLQPSLCRTNLLLQDNEAAALLVTLGLGVCSAVATRGRQSMERNQRRALQQSAVDNSLSTYIPEKDRVQPRTGALSAVKASFGVKGDANSPTRAQLTTPPVSYTHLTLPTNREV